MRFERTCLIWLTAVTAYSMIAAAGAQENGQEDARELFQDAGNQVKRLKMRVRGEEEDIQHVEKPLLTFGDTTRGAASGTLWAFGKSGRPIAFLELYRREGEPFWLHTVTLTGTKRVSMVNPLGDRWTPEDVQVEPKPVDRFEQPSDRDAVRLRRMKDLARRFTAHEFWDPNNSRYELRLLVQPIHRYSDAKAGIHDGGLFVLAHGTNPEVLLLIEALGDDVKSSKWHYSLARQGSAELHVELDGNEVWRRERVAGTDPRLPYLFFYTPVQARR